MESESTSIDIASIKARALAAVEEQGSLLNLGQAGFAHNALRHALSQPRQHEGFRRPATLGNTADDSTGLPSTVPESHHIFDASVPASLPPEAPTSIPARKMNSQSALDATQELSPNYWELHISRTRSAVNVADRETQHTLHEGDEGFVDITSSLGQQEADDDDEGEESRDFSPSQSQQRLPQFPESQRFKTPAAAGKKRDYYGNTRESPELPRAPVLRSGGPTPAHLMGLTQAFDATQAATSPFVNGAINPLSDRPSPNLEVDNRPATATVSSPLLRPLSEFRRATTEPATRYVSVRQSQEERERRAQLDLLDQDDDESDDDGFSEEPSLVKALRRRREYDARAREEFRLVSSPSKARPRGNSAIKSSPVLAAQRSSPSPPPGLRLSGTRIGRLEEPAPDDEDIEPSEAETEQEEEAGVEIRRSSQTSPMDDDDKENYDGHMQVPETTAGFRRLVHSLPSQVEASPSVRHGAAAPRTFRRPVESSGPIAVANSQPSQPASRSQNSRQNPKSSSTSGIDFVPQSQANTALQAASAAATQTPPPLRQVISAQKSGSANEMQDQEVAEDEQEAGTEASVPDQSSAPAQLGPMVLETDSTGIAQCHRPYRSTNSAPQANSLSTSVFETAATRLPPASSRTTKLSELSSPPIVTTPPGRKRKRMSEISAEPSPQQQSTQGFDPMEALHMGSDVQAFPDESPIRPKARQAKRAKLHEHSVEINETVASASRRLTRATQQDTASPSDGHMEPQQGAEMPSPRTEHPAIDPPNLRVSTRSRASVWELNVSPPQKRVPTRDMDKQASSPAVLAQKGKALPSTAPPKKQPQQKDQAPTRAQTQASTSANDLTQATPIGSKPPPGDVTAPNVVFACFNGRTRGYYPARCLGSIDAEVPRYRVQWQGFEPDEVDAFGVRSLDLRVGDQVKIDMKEQGFPRVSHIVHGFKNKAVSTDIEQLTDIRGYKTLLVAPKQRKSLPADVSTETVSEVPVSAIYLDSNMWNQMKERSYEFRPPPDASISASGYATPTERASTPSTPSSRNRRQTAAQPVVEIPLSTGLFANMAFAISYEDDSRKTALVNRIRENGGRLLRESFNELLEPDTISIKPQFVNTGFTALMADKHSRKEKYMQALALGIPCISGKWLEACSEAEALVDWHPYLLAAGESEELEGATKSRLMERMDPAQAKLSLILGCRPRLLAGTEAVVVMGRGKSEAKRRPYLFLIQALGAKGIEKVGDIKAAKDLVKSDDRFDWLFVEDNNVEAARAELSGKGKKKGTKSCKVAGNELIVQSLIMGQLFTNGGTIATFLPISKPAYRDRAMSAITPAIKKTYTLLLLGDLQLGRLIDALLPTSIARQSPHTDPESAAKTVDTHFLPRHPELKVYNYASPWGNALRLVRNECDVVLANLETALTTSERRWERKVFNYRSHPGNANVLLEAGFGKARGYVSLANNHTLDWEVGGSVETVETLERSGVGFAGVGRGREEAERYAVLVLGDEEEGKEGKEDDGYEVRCWSFSDHPSDWNIQNFNLIDYSERSRQMMMKQIMNNPPTDQGNGNRILGLKVVSLHWGPNYRWHPAKEIIELAHWLIDECVVDIIHGHSSHHIQGVEVYRGKLVVYGCGDFVDDYARDGKFRNDLSAAWRVSVGEREEGKREGEGVLEVRKLEVFPNRIKLFQAGLLEKGDDDHDWVERKFRDLCEEFGTRVEEELGDQGQIVVDVKGQR